MKKLKEYIGYFGMMLAIAGWLATAMYYGKIIQDLQKEMEANQKLWQDQNHINGQLTLIIKLLEDKT